MRLQIQNAFTLVELLVVIAIVGILSGLIIVGMSNSVSSASDARRQNDIDSLFKAILGVGIPQGAFPIQSTVCDVGSTCANLSSAITGTSFPTDPDGSYYKYFSYNGTSFTVYAYLSSGEIYAKGLVNGSCPSGYIDSGHGFCVMQYEARNVGGIATSTPTGNPWASITQTAAISTCASACSGCHLINNAEWIILASDAKQQSSNWSGNVMARGYAASTSFAPADAWTNTVVAPNTGAGYEYNTAADTVGASGSLTYRRTLNLANNNVIWDLSGNIWEWTNDTCIGGTGTGNWYNSGAWIEWTNSNLADYEKRTAGPAGSYTGYNGVGRYYGCTSNGNAFLRGGGWNGGSVGGVFYLYLYYSPGYSGAAGFRCAR